MSDITDVALPIQIQLLRERIAALEARDRTPRSARAYRATAWYPNSMDSHGGRTEEWKLTAYSARDALVQAQHRARREHRRCEVLGVGPASESEGTERP